MPPAGPPDRDLLRRLADVDLPDRSVLSVYVDLDPSEFATGPARSSAVTSVTDDAARLAEEAGRELTHDARMALRADVERAREYLATADFDGTRGVAIFAAGRHGLFEVLHLPYPVENGAAVDTSPQLTPLAAAAAREEPWCVLLVNRRNARILRGGPERLREQERLEDDVPGRHDQGGLSQARYQRSIDEEALRHLKRTARAVDQHRRQAPFDHLLVGGPEEAYSAIVELLDPELSARLRGRVEVDVESTTPAQVVEAAAPLMREHERRRQDELLDLLQERLGTGGRAAAGLDEVLACLNERRVETLLLDAGFAVAGAECQHCGWIGALRGGECPVDGTELESHSDIVPEAVERAIEQDADVVTLRDRLELGAHGGIAALLRF